MPENVLEVLKTIDPASLTAIVREATGRPNFEIVAWSVGRLRTKGTMVRDNLWLFSGRGHDHHGEQPWELVLKILEHLQFYPPEQAEKSSPSDMLNWERERLVAQNGLTRRLPGPVKAPRFFSTADAPGGAWLWMERVH